MIEKFRPIRAPRNWFFMASNCIMFDVLHTKTRKIRLTHIIFNPCSIMCYDALQRSKSWEEEPKWNSGDPKKWWQISGGTDIHCYGSSSPSSSRAWTGVDQTSKPAKAGGAEKSGFKSMWTFDNIWKIQLKKCWRVWMISWIKLVFLPPGLIHAPWPKLGGSKSEESNVGFLQKSKSPWYAKTGPDKTTQHVELARHIICWIELINRQKVCGRSIERRPRSLQCAISGPCPWNDGSREAQNVVDFGPVDGKKTVIFIPRSCTWTVSFPNFLILL